jgi:hypothetical protein
MIVMPGCPSCGSLGDFAVSVRDHVTIGSCGACGAKWIEEPVYETKGGVSMATGRTRRRIITSGRPVSDDAPA